jgi:alpha-galactosidase
LEEERSLGNSDTEEGKEVGPRERDRVIEISNKFETFRFDLASGRCEISLAKGKGVSISEAYASVVLSNGKKIATSDNWRERTWERSVNKKEGGGYNVSLRVTHKGSPYIDLKNTLLVLLIEFFAESPEVLVSLELLNESGEPLSVKEFQPLVIEGGEGGAFTLGSSTRNWRFLKHGYQTSSPCYSLSLTELDKTCSVEYFRSNYNPRSKYNAVKGEYDSEWMTVLRDNYTRNVAVIGFVTMKDQMSQIDFKVDEKSERISGLWARSISDNIACKSGESIRSEKLLVDIADSINEGLDLYASRVAAEMAAVPSTKILTGWCSWYEFFESISEDTILNIIDFYKRNREKYPIEYIQVDDGYFTHRGDWTTPSSLFPHGMKFIAEEIRAAGFKPGIWLSPFQISGGSKIFKEHPEWTVRDNKGKPIGEGFDASMKYSYYGLDCTNPQVIDWLKSLFRTITKDWGYEYLKIDFLQAAAIDGERYEKNITRAQALRRGLEAIRESVGNQIPILGCISPIGQAIGLVNSYRISPDTATRWKSPWPFDCGPALGDTMRNTILRYFMHNKFWSNDPDCVIARRGKERSDYPKAAEIEYLAQGGTISEDEVRFEFTVLGILGGPVVYSDDPTHLPPEREKYLPLLLPPFQAKARIVDLLEEALPKILDLKIDKRHDTWDLVGLLNWDDSPSDGKIDFTKIGLRKDLYYHVFSFWDEKYLGRIRGALTIKNIAAHSASLLSIREARSRPQLICSTVHISQGAAEIEKIEWNDKTGTLVIALRHPGRGSGKLFIYAPPPFRFVSITPVNANVSHQKDNSGGTIVVIEVDFKHSANISVKFQ